MLKKHYIPLWILLLLGTACSQGGGQGGTSPLPKDQPSQPASPDGLAPSSGGNVQKVLVPVDFIKLPCSEVRGSPDENELTITIPADQVDNCPGGSSLLRFRFDLISKTYAAEDLPPSKGKKIRKVRCLYPCRVKGDSVEFDVPFESGKTIEKQLLLYQRLQEFYWILKLELTDPTHDVLSQLSVEIGEGGQSPVEERDKETFHRNFKKEFQIKLELDEEGEGKEEDKDADKDQDKGDEGGDKKEDKRDVKEEEGIEEPEEPKEEPKNEPPAEVKDKNGWKELGPVDLKTDPPSHHLKLFVGQRFDTGTDSDFVDRIERCSAGDPAQYKIISLQYFNPNPNRKDLHPSLTIKGLADGEATVRCDTQVKNFGKALLVIFIVVEDPSKPKVEPPWEWKLPEWKDYLTYFGGLPECRMADGSESHIIQVGLQKIEGDHYQMIMEEEARWQGGMKGGYRFRRLSTSDKEVATVSFGKERREFVIRSVKMGSALVSFEAVQIKDVAQVVPEEAWKKLEILVTVYPYFETDAEREQGGRLCPGEVKVEEPTLDTCPALEVLPPAEPDHSVEAPATLTAEEQSLADKLYKLFGPSNTPAVCSDAMLRRQSQKLAHAFYAVPTPDYLLASCVTCANNVGNGLAEALKDEKTACFKILNIGRGNVPILDVPTHAATAVFPACSELGDQSLVLDTWFAPGNWIPSLHQHRVFRLADWKSGKITDFGLQKEQTNLPK